MKTILYLTMVLTFAVPTLAAYPASAPATQPVTAILSALTDESALLEQSLSGKHEQKIQGIRFVSGKLAGRNVVLVVSGMGKVNAAVVTTLLIEHFSPKEILFSGIAGCLNPKLGLGDIVIAERTTQHDLLHIDRKHVTAMEIFSPVDDSKNPEYFPADPYLLRTSQAAASHVRPAVFHNNGKDRPSRIVTGLVVTGDQFIGADAKKKELQKRYHADACEMEGAAVAQVCYQFAVPCLIIRSISDLADNAADKDVDVFMKAAANNAAAFVKEVVTLLAQPVENCTFAPTSRPAAAAQPAAVAN
jgi:adenosylhomocysteine nucleosidase